MKAAERELADQKRELRDELRRNRFRRGNDPILVQVHGLSQVYSSQGIENVALRGIDLTIEQGEFTAIFGPSGSGKSSLLRLLGALDQPTSGRVVLEGVDLSELDEAGLSTFRLHKIGFVLPADNLIPMLTARENIEFALYMQGRNSGDRQALATDMLTRVGLSGLAGKLPIDMSSGQQQRAALARAVAGRPEVLIADEPTAHLDGVSARKLLDLMRTLNREEGTTFVYATHDPRMLERADRVIELTDGEICSDDVRRRLGPTPL